MAKSPSRFILVVIAAYVCYAVMAALQIFFWADLLAPVCNFLAAAMVFHALLTSKNKQFRLNSIFAGTAILTWALADALWFVYSHFLGVDPNDIAIVNILNFCTNVCLVAAMLLYAYFRLRKWDTVQLILDGLVFAISILWLIWSLMYNKSFGRVAALLDYSVMHTLSVGMDLFLIVVISIWCLSIRKGSTPAFLRILVISVFAYAAVDLLYYHLYANNLYVPDSLVDILYLGTLVLLAVSIKLYYNKYPAIYANENPNTNIGNVHKGLFLLLCPLLIILLGTITASDIALYSVIILFHEGGRC